MSDTVEVRIPLKYTEDTVLDALRTMNADKFITCIPHPSDPRGTFDGEGVDLDLDSLDWDEDTQTGTVVISRQWSSYYGCKDMDDAGTEEDFVNLHIEGFSLVASCLVTPPQDVPSPEDEWPDPEDQP
jgi:hypothetical protein